MKIQICVVYTYFVFELVVYAISQIPVCAVCRQQADILVCHPATTAQPAAARAHRTAEHALYIAQQEELRLPLLGAHRDSLPTRRR